MRTEMTRAPEGNSLNQAHRRQFLLSGLLTCGCCGGGYTIVAQDRYGCATRKGKGTCANNRTIMRPNIERRVLSALRDSLLPPALVDEFSSLSRRRRRTTAKTSSDGSWGFRKS